MGIRDIPGSVSTAAQDKLQPWQAVFAIFTFVITQFDMSSNNVLILIGMVSLTLGFVMRSTYKHKEAVKAVVAPWLLQSLLKIVEDYLPATPEPDQPLEPIDEPELTRKELIERLTAIGTSNGSGST